MILFQVLAMLCFGFGLMIGFPYCIVWALFYDEPDDTDEDRLFRSYIVNRLRLAAALLFAGALFALINAAQGG